MSNSSSERRLHKRLVNGGSPLNLLERLDDGRTVTRTFFASEFDDHDIIELDEWCRAQYIRMARQSLTADMPDGERKETLALAMELASGLTWTSPRGAKVMDTPAGWTQIAWRMVRKNHAEMTLARMQSLIWSPENQLAAQEAFEGIYAATAAAGEAEAAQKKTASKPRKKR